MNTASLHHHLKEACKHIGRRFNGAGAPDALSAEQRRRFLSPNVMSPQRVESRFLAGGALFVEIAVGDFMNKPIIGLTVFNVGELAGDAGQWDHSLSGAFSTPAEVAGRLAELDAGGRERVAALTKGA